jgi:DtxR family transcriptional regulator, Mn-dependent transcriptional regulator
MRTSRLDKANRGTRPPTVVAAHYLEAIFYIRAEGEVVRSARLADWLGVSRPTVAAALGRMTRDGLVRFNSRKEIELTARGEAAAAAIVRRHRIVERWLTDVLGLDWVTADTEAEKLEHAISDLVAEKLYRALGGPQTCPHGNPIPGHATMRADELRLSGLKEGESGVITRISEVAQREAPPLLQYLHDRRLHPGARVLVEEVDEVGRTMRLRAASTVTLSTETAAKLSVVRSAKPRRGRAPAGAHARRGSPAVARQRVSVAAPASRQRRSRSR